MAGRGTVRGVLDHTSHTAAWLGTDRRKLRMDEDKKRIAYRGTVWLNESAGVKDTVAAGGSVVGGCAVRGLQVKV